MIFSILTILILNQIAETPVDNIQENDIMNSLVNSFLSSTKKKEKVKTLTEDIEEDIFACWILLGISEAKIIYLYTLANKIIKKLRDDITALPIPHNGQDILRKRTNKSNTKLIYRNIYTCSICYNINTFNNGRKNPLLSNIQCSNPTCNKNICDKQVIIPLIPRIKALLVSSLLTRDLTYYTKEQIKDAFNNKTYKDSTGYNLPIPQYMYGSTYKRLVTNVINKGDIFLFFQVTTDGISVFNKAVAAQNKSANPILVRLLNCVEEKRIESCLSILINEFLVLGDGIDMPVFVGDTVQTKRVVGILLDVFGDTLAISHVGHFLGPTSTFPCRFCNMSSDRHIDNFHQGIKCSCIYSFYSYFRYFHSKPII
ncbi:hypothetical protein WA158_007385 [Blastocystis sp. Blastoise]